MVGCETRRGSGKRVVGWSCVERQGLRNRAARGVFAPLSPFSFSSRLAFTLPHVPAVARERRLCEKGGGEGRKCRFFGLLRHGGPADVRRALAAALRLARHTHALPPSTRVLRSTPCRASKRGGRGGVDWTARASGSERLREGGRANGGDTAHAPKRSLAWLWGTQNSRLDSESHGVMCVCVCGKAGGGVGEKEESVWGIQKPPPAKRRKKFDLLSLQPADQRRTHTAGDQN